MNPEEFRAILSRSRVGIWELIEAAIKVAGSDYGDELQRRRDKIVESLYTPAAQLCRNCNGGLFDDGALDEPYYPQAVSNNYNNSDNIIDNNNYEEYNDNSKKYDKDDSNKRISNDDFSKSPLTPESNHRGISGGEDQDDVDPYGGLFDDEQTKILSIKEQLEDPHQSEDDVVQLLQNLGDMDITFQALKETDIGRHVNRLRKHPSNEVRVLVKQLVRKWKDTVDEWVRVNQPKATSNLIGDGDSPQQSIPKNQQNGHQQVPDFGYSPNPQNGNNTVERNFGEHETKTKAPKPAPRKEAPCRPPQSLPKTASAPLNRPPRETVVDDERLNSARRRLQENYQEAQNAKKQRTIQVMDIHEIPKPKAKNTFFAKNKGGFQGRQHR
ncbi:probable mediator of RNA polymerase ii transcription subunit 26c [Phtheirospermum japonicum]|uniref:Probable mediator of RNA polymerase ii transcription subunit 26c n=1 Tax=Phtheirospermum japonicum TaxID=374723 RepID=A0A830C8J5_9LAMI|nr:probable mediator of RNA polymerase ii transcription subunit 26c [Phtheirospermum japonicum]